MNKNFRCLGYIGDEILPGYVGDYQKPLSEFLLNNQYLMES